MDGEGLLTSCCAKDLLELLRRLLQELEGYDIPLGQRVQLVQAPLCGLEQLIHPLVSGLGVLRGHEEEHPDSEGDDEGDDAERRHEPRPARGGLPSLLLRRSLVHPGLRRGLGRALDRGERPRESLDEGDHGLHRRSAGLWRRRSCLFGLPRLHEPLLVVLLQLAAPHARPQEGELLLQLSDRHFLDIRGDARHNGCFRWVVL
mmetsp:Transcript_9510/g.28910  ORF Transcript_9510/g.28910 Transcript_9510/m.28910 type:complete len:203 (+) Transcript_9510:148-756(+)